MENIKEITAISRVSETSRVLGYSVLEIFVPPDTNRVKSRKVPRLTFYATAIALDLVIFLDVNFIFFRRGHQDTSLDK